MRTYTKATVNVNSAKYFFDKRVNEYTVNIIVEADEDETSYKKLIEENQETFLSMKSLKKYLKDLKKSLEIKYINDNFHYSLNI
jgi:hypothetical protein